MKKKYIVTTIMFLLTMMVTLVVSFSWFEGDFNDKKAANNEVKISTSQDLLLFYKGSSYTSLNISDELSSDFEFNQVTTTDANEGTFYKIDYTNELDDLPAEYVTASAGVDYIEFDIMLKAQSAAKRVYIDAVNSGFSNILEDFGEYIGIKPADCMRCSLSFNDSKTSTYRTVILMNKSIESYSSSVEARTYNNTILDDDIVVYERDSSLNEVLTKSLYLNGKKQYNRMIEGTSDNPDYYASVTGVQVPSYFNDYDYSAVNSDKVAHENTILFDLQAYQEKNLKIRIWLEGTAVPNLEESNDYISGQGIRFSLSFATTNDLGIDVGDSYICSGMTTNIINTYRNKTGFCSVVVDEDNENYLLKNYSTSGNNLLVTDEDNNTWTYSLDQETNCYLCTNLAHDSLYYDLDTSRARIKYSSLKWKLLRVNKTRDNTVTTDNTTVDENVTIAILNSDYSISVVGSALDGTSAGDGYTYRTPLNGETFSVIGYIDLGSDMVVVNYFYMVTDEYETTKKDYVASSTDTKATYDSENDYYEITIENIISSVYNDTSMFEYDDFFYHIIDGNVYSEIYSYNDLTWSIYENDNDLSVIVDNDPSLTKIRINNFSRKKDTNYTLPNGTYEDCNYVFNLKGILTVSSTNYEVIDVQVVINN